MARRRLPRARARPAGMVMVVSLLVVACAPGGSAVVSPSVVASSASPVVTSTPEPTTALSPRTSTPTSTPKPSPESSAPTVVVPAWRELEADGSVPPAREDGTWTVSPDGQTAWLFGGRDGDRVFDDLWAYDLEADRWTALSPGGAIPLERFGHEAVWVDGVGVVVFAGQAGPSTFFDDLWAYDPAAGRWREVPVDGARPKARYGTCAAVGPDGRLWISHGFTEDGTRFSDTQAFDFDTGRWSDETPSDPVPVRRCLHGCWWTDDGRFALYAGQTTGVGALGDLWTVAGAGTSTAAWTKVSGALPPDRSLYAFARRGDGVVVVGGRGLDGFLDDAFSIDATTLAIGPIEVSGGRPPARAGGMLIDDPDRGRVLLFGGKSGEGSLADLWELRLP